MNNHWKKETSKVFGYFWERVFKGDSIVKWIKYTVSDIGDHLNRIHQRIQKSRSIFDDTPMDNPCICVLIPADECIDNYNPISDYTLSSDYVVKQYSHTACLGIPVKYIPDKCMIQTACMGSCKTWVSGINMSRNSQYTVLHDYNHNDITPIYLTIAGKMVKHYKLYIRTTDCDGSTYNDTFGELMGVDLRGLPTTVCQDLWEVYRNGPTLFLVNKLLSAAVGNDICCNDSVVSETWEQHDVWYVMDADGRVYHGRGRCLVHTGDNISKGDLLFSGIVIADSEHIPSPADLPVISISSSYGGLYAVNKRIPVVSANGKAVPNMANQEWIQAALASEYTFIEPGTAECNPVEYLFTNIFPGYSTQYIIQGAPDIDSKILEAVSRIIVHGFPISGTSMISETIFPSVSGMVMPSCSGISVCPALDIATVNITPKGGEIICNTI